MKASVSAILLRAVRRSTLLAPAAVDHQAPRPASHLGDCVGRRSRRISVERGRDRRHGAEALDQVVARLERDLTMDTG
jgi:hypothetical protein